MRIQGLLLTAFLASEVTANLGWLFSKTTVTEDEVRYSVTCTYVEMLTSL